MLASLLSRQLSETLNAAKAADDERVRQAAGGVPKGFLPPSGARDRAAAATLRAFVDVAQTLERCAFAGDRRAQAELVAFARYLCADDVAAELARRFAWQAQGAVAVPRPTRKMIGRTHLAPAGRVGDLPEPAAPSLPPKPACTPYSRRKATHGLVEATAQWLRQAWA